MHLIVVFPFEYWLQSNCEWNFSATVPAAIFAILASYGDCNETFVVTMLSLAISSLGFGSSGLSLVAFDLTPNYIAPFNGVVHTCYSIAALLAPFIVAAFTPHAYLSEWRYVWWFTFATLIASAVVFMIWGSAKIQPWNTGEKRRQNS